MKKYWPLLVPVVLYTAFAITDIFWFRCAIIVFLLAYVLWLLFAKVPKEHRCKAAFIPAAFFFSIIGDLFLHFDEGRAPLFIAGVAVYFVAHMSYIGFSLRRGKVNWWMMGILTTLFTVYFIFLLYPNISNTGILVAVFLYILVSCFSVSAASGMPLGDGMDKLAKGLVIGGISSLLFSDFVLSLHDFVGVQTGYFLMLPTFYLSQMLVTAALIHLFYEKD